MRAAAADLQPSRQTRDLEAASLKVGHLPFGLLMPSPLVPFPVARDVFQIPFPMPKPPARTPKPAPHMLPHKPSSGDFEHTIVRQHWAHRTAHRPLLGQDPKNSDEARTVGVCCAARHRLPALWSVCGLMGLPFLTLILLPRAQFDGSLPTWCNEEGSNLPKRGRGHSDTSQSAPAAGGGGLPDCSRYISPMHTLLRAGKRWVSLW